MRSTLLTIAALAIVVLVAYGNSFHGPFVFDDVPGIRDNWSIHHFRTAFWPPGNTTVSGRPLLNLSFAANYALSGLGVVSYHIGNLLLHLTATLLAFGLARRLANHTRLRGQATGFAFVVAALWAVHPLCTEAVTYSVQRAESLMAVCYLASLYFYARFAERPRARINALACWCFCVLGMASKEVMVSAPVTMFIMDRIFFAGSYRKAWSRRYGLLGAVALTWVLLFFLIAASGFRGGTVGSASGVSWIGYIASQFPAVLHYLRLAFWPHPLVFDYGTLWLDHARGLWFAIPVVVALAAASLVLLARGSAIGFLGFWFFAILAPTSLIAGNRQTLAEHRIYLALLPLVALVIGALWSRWGRKTWPVAASLILAGIIVTRARNRDYRDPITLWSEAVDAVPTNYFAHTNLADELQGAGRLREAIAQYHAALQIRPNYADGYNNLGIALDHSGQLSDAAQAFRRAVALEPTFAIAHANLGSVLVRTGHPMDGAQQDLAAVNLLPRDPTFRDDLGNALVYCSRLNDAIGQYKEALRLVPDFAPAHYDLAVALSQSGQPDAAMAEYDAAARLTPSDPRIPNNQGILLAQRQQWQQAAACFERAATIAPTYAPVHFNRGLCLQQMGQTQAAIAEFRTALRLQPDYPDARRALEMAGATP